MASYTLIIGFSATDLKSFYATGTNLVLANPVQGLTWPNVAWLVFQPLESNSVTWSTAYGLYASGVDVTPGAVLKTLSRYPAPLTMGWQYTYLANGMFGPPQNIGLTAGVAVLDQYDNRSNKGYLTFGLNQDATVNQSATTANAVSAQGIVYQTAGTLIPSNTVCLWLQAGVVSNSVVQVVPGVVTCLTFSSGSTTQTLTYQSSTGQFVPTANGISLGVVMDYRRKSA
ncbi:MAG: hypothetical protein HQL82_08955 [Magnetococcales bacterium]|nr:hypothetical protein [Magnetococcales bacterium]